MEIDKVVEYLTKILYNENGHRLYKNKKTSYEIAIEEALEIIKLYKINNKGDKIN